MVYFFTNTTIWEEYLAVKEQVNFKIMEILDEADVSVAYPSRSLYIDHEKHELKNEIDESK